MKTIVTVIIWEIYKFLQSINLLENGYLLRYFLPYVLAHNAVVTAAIFAPCPWNVVPTEYDDNSTGRTGPEVIVAADWKGSIKIFINRYSNEKT